MNKDNSKCNNHLTYSIDSDGDLELTVYPDILFLDFNDGIYDSEILKTNLQLSYFSRPKKSNVNKKKQKKNTNNFYNFSLKDLETSLAKGGHIKI